MQQQDLLLGWPLLQHVVLCRSSQVLLDAAVGIELLVAEDGLVAAEAAVAPTGAAFAATSLVYFLARHQALA